MKTRILANTMVMGFLLLTLTAISLAQSVPIPHHREAYFMDSGAHQGRATEMNVAFREVVRVSGAPWLQLHIGAHNLGNKSYVSVTSLKDGHTQRLDGRSLPEWQGSTAYFNGDAVDVQLHVAVEEENIFIRITDVTVGEWVQPNSGFRQETICGATDNRVASNDPRVGRIVPVGCTGWIVSNGAHLTAGHCTGANMQILQFNVPASQANGTIVAPPPEDQYPINAATVVFANNGQGDDWAIFGTNRNANTGQLPVERQSAFYRMSRDSNPATIRVTGYGLDGPGPSPACPTCDFGNTGTRNADNQTEQTHAGASQGESVQNANRVVWNYAVDTQPANSGSPLIIDGSTLTVGIHTNGGCTATGGGNSGTGFENDSLENAINAFVGANARYVDASHPIGFHDGSSLRPFNTVNAGVTAVPNGGIVSFVTGAYPENITISRPMTLTAPVGPVTIGQ